jgi:hypothetical protein
MAEPSFAELTSTLPRHRVIGASAYRSCACGANLQVSSSDVALVREMVRQFDGAHRVIGHAYGAHFHHVTTAVSRPDLGPMVQDYRTGKAGPDA